MAQDKFKMSPEEFSDIRAQVAAIGQQDVQLGRVLTALVLHLGHAYGLDPVQEDARLKAEAEAKAASTAAPVEESVVQEGNK